MTIHYGKLWQMCVEHDMKPYDFSSDKNSPYYLSRSTIYEMLQNHPVSLQAIDSICSYFKCQPCDIMEFV